jgi:polyhydroxyalkanoate synthesis repressor PhaR
MAGDTGRSAEPVLIKKYGNRRLYDTRRSRYITLGELAKIVQSGATVRVVDAAGGRDLTRQVLTQVILEGHEGLDTIPVELLHLIIRTQGTLEQAPFSALLSTFTRHLAAASHHWTLPWTTWLRALSDVPAPPSATPSVAAEAGEPPAPEAEAAPEGAEEAAGEPAAAAAVDGLQRRIDGLMRKLRR